MATTNDDGFREIQLNGKQLVFLFMAVTVASVVIFLCGVLVGRGVAVARGVTEASPLEAVEFEPPVGELTAATTGPGGAPATASEDLSYTDRLESDAPVAESLQSAQPAPPTVMAEAPAGEPETSAPAPSPEPETAAGSGDPAVPGEPAGSGFAIQVAALRDRGEAEAVARRLASRGYPAYVLMPDPGTPVVFRVRVGKFPERREAESVAARLEKEEQFKPWITR